jgi:hypothetical protein
MSPQYRRNPRPGAGSQPLFPMGIHTLGEDMSNPRGTQFPVRKTQPLFFAAAGIKHVFASASAGSGPTWVSTSGTRPPHASATSRKLVKPSTPYPPIR